MRATTIDARPGGTRTSSFAAPNRITLSVRKQRMPFQDCYERMTPKLLRENDTVFFCPQTIAEFWNVATRPADRNGLGLSHDEVLKDVGNFERLLTLLPDVPAIYNAWKRIVAVHKVKGIKVYDARLIAIMSVYAVEGILTFNKVDFERFTNVRAIHPSTL